MTAAPLLALALTLSPPALAAFSVYGFNFPAWWSDAYDKPEASRSLEGLAATRARWTAVIPTWYQDSYRADALRRTDRTASDDSLRRIIRQARAQGLRVALKPHVDVEGKEHRGLIRPRDPQAWFAAYEAMILDYARLAQEEGVELFVVGTELFLMDGPDQGRRWKELVRKTRGAYSGKLTYAAMWYEFWKVPFWGELDYIGVDGYFPVAGGSNRTLLRLGWRAVLPALLAVSRLHGKPILFTELGLASQKGANLRPWDWHDFGPVDLDVQRAYLEAFLDVFEREPWCAGFLYWAWDLNPAAGGPQDKSMVVQGKPALETLKGSFRRAQAPPPAASGLEKAASRVLGLLRAPRFP